MICTDCSTGRRQCQNEGKISDATMERIWRISNLGLDPGTMTGPKLCTFATAKKKATRALGVGVPLRYRIDVLCRQCGTLYPNTIWADNTTDDEGIPVRPLA